jgi:hypothetical protein
MPAFGRYPDQPDVEAGQREHAGDAPSQIAVQSIIRLKRQRMPDGFTKFFGSSAPKFSSIPAMIVVSWRYAIKSICSGIVGTYPHPAKSVFGASIK